MADGKEKFTEDGLPIVGKQDSLTTEGEPVTTDDGLPILKKKVQPEAGYGGRGHSPASLAGGARGGLGAPSTGNGSTSTGKKENAFAQRAKSELAFGGQDLAFDRVERNNYAKWRDRPMPEVGDVLQPTRYERSIPSNNPNAVHYTAHQRALINGTRYMLKNTIVGSSYETAAAYFKSLQDKGEDIEWLKDAIKHEDEADQLHEVAMAPYTGALHGWQDFLLYDKPENVYKRLGRMTANGDTPLQIVGAELLGPVLKLTNAAFATMMMIPPMSAFVHTHEFIRMENPEAGKTLDAIMSPYISAYEAAKKAGVAKENIPEVTRLMMEAADIGAITALFGAGHELLAGGPKIKLENPTLKNFDPAIVKHYADVYFKDLYADEREYVRKAPVNEVPAAMEIAILKHDLKQVENFDPNHPAADALKASIHAKETEMINRQAENSTQIMGGEANRQTKDALEVDKDKLSEAGKKVIDENIGELNKQPTTEIPDGKEPTEQPAAPEGGAPAGESVPEGKAAGIGRGRTPKARRKIRNKRYLEALKQDATTPREEALQYFIGGGEIDAAAIRQLFGKGGKMPKGEYRAHFGLIRKGAPDIEQLAHQLWENRSNESLTTMDYRDAVESVLLEHNGRKGMVEEIMAARDKADEHYYDNVPDEYKDFDPDVIEYAQDVFESISDEDAQKIANDLASPEYIDKLVESYLRDEGTTGKTNKPAGIPTGGSKGAGESKPAVEAAGRKTPTREQLAGMPEITDPSKIKTAAEAHKYADQNGFGSANELINSFNKDRATEYENIQDIPPHELKAFIDNRKAQQEAKARIEKLTAKPKAGKEGETKKSEQNAVRKRSTKEILQRQPGETGKTGSERGRVERGQQGKAPAGKGTQEKAPSEGGGGRESLSQKTREKIAAFREKHQSEKPQKVITETEDVSTENYNDLQKRVVDRARKVVKAVAPLIKKQGKKISVVLHDSPVTYAEAVKKAGGSAEDAMTTNAFYLDKDGAIHLNMEYVRDNTIYHEGFHPILDYASENNPSIVKSMFDELSSVSGSKPFIEWAKQYKDDTTRMKEAITEFVAAVADGRVKLNPTRLDKIRNFILSVMQKLGIDVTPAYQLQVKTNDGLRQFANLVSSKFRKGEAIKPGDVEAIGRHEPLRSKSEMRNAVKQGKVQFQKDEKRYLREGQLPIGIDSDMTARERFDIGALEKDGRYISEGSDRYVYDLGDGNVLKVAKNSRGLTQNLHEADWHLSQTGILPELKEVGANYIVSEKVTPMLGWRYAKDRYPELYDMLQELQDYTQDDFDRKDSDLQDVLHKYDLDEIMNYDVLWVDFAHSINNWGVDKNGNPIHLDGGTFGGVAFLSGLRGMKSLDDPEFLDYYNRSREAKRKFGDRDMRSFFQKREDVKLKPLPAGLEVVEGFYSPIEKTLRETKRDQLSAKQWMDMFGKSDEAVYTGLRAMLESKKPDEQIKKQEVLDYLSANRMRVDLVYSDEMRYRALTADLDYFRTKSENALFELEKAKKEGNKKDEEIFRQQLQDAEERLNAVRTEKDKMITSQWEEYILPGNYSHYREILMTLPEKTRPIKYYAKAEEGGTWGVVNDKGEPMLGASGLTAHKAYEIAQKATESHKSVYDPTQNYRSPHWDTSNVIAHIRSTRRATKLDIPNKETKERFDAATKSLVGFIKNMVDKYDINDWREKMNPTERGRYEALDQIAVAASRDANTFRKATYMIEEFQSDWAQQGRKEGFGIKKIESKYTEEEISNARKYYEKQKATRQIYYDVGVFLHGLNANVANVRVLAEAGIDAAKKQIEKSVERQIGSISVAGKKDHAYMVEALKERAQRLIDRLSTANKDFNWDEFVRSDQMLQQARNERIELSTGVPNAPYVEKTKGWLKLALKVALRDAIERGAERLSWTSGKQQNERWDLSHVVEVIRNKGNSPSGDNAQIFMETNQGTSRFDVNKGTGEITDVRGGILKSIEGKKLSDVIGKELAGKVMEGPGDYRPKDMELEGKPMNDFYGNPNTGDIGIVGKMAESLWGRGSVKTTEFEHFRNSDVAKEAPHNKLTSKQHYVEITPAMKEEVEQGLPQFQKGTNPRLDDMKDIVKDLMKDHSREEVRNMIVSELGNTKENRNLINQAFDELIKPSEGEIEKTLEKKRVFEGGAREGVKDVLAEMGLNREQQNRAIAKKDANEFVDRVGFDKALEALKQGDVHESAVSTFVFGRLVNDLEKKMAVVKDEKKLHELERQEAELLSHMGTELVKGGQRSAAMADVYMESELRYKLSAQLQDYKDRFGSVPPDVEARFREINVEVQNLNARIAKVEKERDAAYAELEMNQLKGAVGRVEEPKEPRKRSFSKEKQDRLHELRKELAPEIRGMFHDVTGVIAKLTDKRFREYASLVIEEMASDFKDFSTQLIKDFGSKIKPYLPKIFMDNGGKFAADDLIDSKVMAPVSMLKDLIDSGVDNITDLTKAVHEYAKVTNPDVTIRQVRDAITGYGREKSMTRSDLTKQLDQMKRAGRLMSKLEDLRAGKQPEKHAEQVKRSAEEESLLAQIQELTSALPKEKYRISDKQWLEQRKRATKNRINELNRRVAQGDFSRKAVREVKEDAELHELRGEKLRAQEQYDKEKHKRELQERSWPKKAVDYAWEGWQMTRMLRATGEWSFTLIQGLPEALSHPIYAARAIKKSFEAFASEKKLEEWITHIKAADFYPELKKSRLAITEPNARLKAREELYYSGWTVPIWNTLGRPLWFVSKAAYNRWVQANPFLAIERGAAGYLDTIRVLRWLDGREMLRMQGKTFESHPQDYKNMADVINTLTGRASLGPLEGISEPLTKIFFSPRNWSSVIKTATPYAFWHFGKMFSKEGKYPQVSVAQKMAMGDLFKMIGLTTSIVAMVGARLNNDDDPETGVEMDPTSTDFAKIKIGNMRIDPWGGRIQQVVIQARLWQDVIKNRYGRHVPLGTPFKSASRGELLVDLAVNKLAPSASILAKYLFSHVKGMFEDKVRVTRYGEEYSLKKEILNNLYPIYWETIKEMYDDQGIDAFDGLMIFYAFFGGGVNVYDTSDQASQAVEKGQDFQTFLSDAKKKAPGGKLSDSQIDLLAKKYDAYSAFGARNQDVMRLMEPGASNDSKALYLADRWMEDQGKPKDKRIDIEGLHDEGLISEDLYDKFDDVLEKRLKK